MLEFSIRAGLELALAAAGFAFAPSLLHLWERQQTDVTDASGAVV